MQHSEIDKEISYLANLGLQEFRLVRGLGGGQSDDRIDALWRTQERIARRLGPNWARPKGMWRRTHERLIEKLGEGEQRRNDAFTVAAARLLLIR